MKKTISEIRKTVNPSTNKVKEKNEIRDIALKLIEKQVQKHSEITKVVLGGSFAKGTWLADNADIDIFIKFKKSVTKEKFTKISQKIGFESMKQ